MSGTLADRITRTARRVLLAALAATGLGTAGLLHLRAHQALDEALLAAAAGEAHPWSEERWTPPEPDPAVALRLWRPGDPLVPAAVAQAAIRDNQARWLDVDDRRVLVFSTGPAGASDGAPRDAVVVHAEGVRPWDSAGRFLLAWMLVSSVAATGASFLLRRAIRDATAPLEQAAHDLSRIETLRADTRLAGGGVEEVDVVIRSVNGLLDRLQAAFEAQTRFTAEAAHELRSPVTVLVGELEVALRRERDAAAYRDAIERARVEADRLRERVDALMALARVDAGQADVLREREHVSAIVHAAARTEQRALSEAGCHLAVPPGPDPEVEVHVGLLEVAVANLLRNAAVHAPGSRVTVRTEARDDRIDLVVEDDGPGIPEGDREVLLERFSRGRGARGGLGLGLPLAREIVRRHGGTLRLEGTPDGGCRARITLPVP